MALKQICGTANCERLYYYEVSYFLGCDAVQSGTFKDILEERTDFSFLLPQSYMFSPSIL
jgi:hypothetical protein